MSNGAANQSRARRAFRYAKSTLISGVVFLVPLAVVVYLLGKVGPVLKRLAKPFAGLLPMEKFFGVLVADAMVVVLLLVACFLAGLLARVSLADRFVKKTESGLWRVPGYGFVKAMVDSVDEKAEASMRPVLIHFDDSAQLGFEVDRFPDGRRIVYVPDAPNPRSGSIIVMDANRVEPLPMTFRAALRSMRALGRGVRPSLSPPTT